MGLRWVSKWKTNILKLIDTQISRLIVHLDNIIKTHLGHNKAFAHVHTPLPNSTSIEHGTHSPYNMACPMTSYAIKLTIGDFSRKIQEWNAFQNIGGKDKRSK